MNDFRGSLAPSWCPLKRGAFGQQESKPTRLEHKQDLRPAWEAPYHVLATGI